MLYASSLLAFHHLVNAIDSARSSTLLISIFVSCFLISFVWSDPVKRRRKRMKNLEKFPGPRAYPLIGNAPHLMFPPDEIFSWLETVNRKWGDVVRFWVFGKPKLFVNSYDIAMELLTRKTFLLKSEEFEPLRPIGGHSLAGAPPDIHPFQRKLLGPGFSRQAVEVSLEIFSRHGRKLRDSLMEYADCGKVFNVMDHTGLCAYKIGCETAAGHESIQDLWDVDYKEQIVAWHTLLVHLVNRSFKPWLKSDFIYNRTQAGKQVQQCFQTINTFGEQMIFLRRQRWEFLKSNKFSDDEEDDENQKVKNIKKPIDLKHECFLDLLLDLEDQGEMNKEQVLHDLNVYIVAGYDTTGTTLAWVLHLLAIHPEAQEKCVQELLQVLYGDTEEPRPGSSTSISSSSTKTEPTPLYPSIDSFHATVCSLIFASSTLPIITVSHLKRLKYLESCIKEALRLYPVLPWLLRRTDEDIELDDGRTIPAGVDVPINSYIIHRNPDKYPDPEVFNPDRYSPSEGTAPGLLSFGAGPRVCPGMLFAMHELKVILAHLLLAFKWESDGGDEENGGKKVLFHGVLVPANGINLKISKGQ